MEPFGIMLIQVETELIHTINGLVCLFEFPEIQLALSTKVVVIFVGSIGRRFQGRISLDINNSLGVGMLAKPEYYLIRVEGAALYMDLRFTR
jgi:hypothetical protein